LGSGGNTFKGDALANEFQGKAGKDTVALGATLAHDRHGGPNRSTCSCWPSASRSACSRTRSGLGSMMPSDTPLA
jgi:hypothetical protein